MGFFPFESFPLLQLVHTTTRPVGRWKNPSDTITRIGRAADDSEYAGQLVFLDEVPATMKVAEKIVPYRLQQGDKVTSAVAKWWRFEVQVPISERRVSTKLDVVVARGKLSGDWVAHSRFKGTHKKGQYRRFDSLAEPVKSVEELIQRLESLTYDYWETGKYLTAGVLPPSASMSDKARNDSRDGFRLGACENYERCFDELLKENDQVQELLKMTERGTIRFWPKSGKIPDRNKRLHATARDDGPSLMLQSVGQALAGTDDQDLLGKPVVTLVERIYKSLLYNRNRVLNHVPKSKQKGMKGDVDHA